jgi:hypothetical protein
MPVRSHKFVSYIPGISLVAFLLFLLELSSPVQAQDVEDSSEMHGAWMQDLALFSEGLTIHGFEDLNAADTLPEAEALEVISGSFEGKISYYGYGFHGRRTASGERMHQDSMTAAHPSLPFGTLVRVSLPKTDRSVVLRINDRGPFVHARVLDISVGAARRLGIRTKGVVKARIEVLENSRMLALN